MTTLSIGILLFNGVEELDFVGPLEVFAMAMSQEGRGRVHLIAEKRDLITCAKGMRVMPDHVIDDHPPIDVMRIVAAGSTAPSTAPATTPTSWSPAPRRTCRRSTTCSTRTKRRRRRARRRREHALRQGLERPRRLRGAAAGVRGDAGAER